MAKPDPVIFIGALTAMRAAADPSIHVGDSLHEDFTGARASGKRAMLLDREGKHRDWNEEASLASLLELSQMLP